METIDAVMTARALAYMARDVGCSVIIERSHRDRAWLVRWSTGRGHWGGAGPTIGRAAYAAIEASGGGPEFEREGRPADAATRRGGGPADLFHPPTREAT